MIANEIQHEATTAQLSLLRECLREVRLLPSQDDVFVRAQICSLETDIARLENELGEYRNMKSRETAVGTLLDVK